MGGLVAREEGEGRIVSGGLSGMKLFAGNANRDLATRVADYLNIPLGRLTSTKFSVTPSHG